MPKILSRSMFAHVVFSAITSAIMSAIVCAVMTYKMAGLGAAFAHLWFGGWTTAWPVAFLIIVVVSPLLKTRIYAACKCNITVPTESQSQKIPSIKSGQT